MLCLPIYVEIGRYTSSSQMQPPMVDKLRSIAIIPIPGKILVRYQVKFNYDDIVQHYGPHQHAYIHLGSRTSALIKMHDSVTHHH